ncbi:ABC transporter permease [Nonomuraea insulae]|uniref:ABC transporter permease n=1 Tax=Nonomuraea insulae TaxID=1616787 RepID=A0ABW1CQW8_9ACTN
MTDERTNGGMSGPPGPPPGLAFAQPIVTGILIGTAFLVIFLLALHHPAPNHVPVGVVGSADVVRTLEAGDAIAPHALNDAGQAKEQVMSGEIDAAYVVEGTQHRLIVAGARGPVENRTLTAFFQKLSGQAALEVQDVVPISPQDPNGISVFYVLFGVTLGAFLFGQTMHGFRRFLSLGRKLLALAIFSVLLGAISSAVAQGLVGAVPGNPLGVMAVMALLAASVAAFTMGVTTLLGDIGVAVSTIIALILGTAVSGGAGPASFLPAGFAWMSQGMPPGAAATALRDVVYYDAGAALGPVAVMLVWLAISLLVVVGAPAGRRRTEQVVLPAVKTAPSA